MHFDALLLGLDYIFLCSNFLNYQFVCRFFYFFLNGIFRTMPYCTQFQVPMRIGNFSRSSLLSTKVPIPNLCILDVLLLYESIKSDYNWPITCFYDLFKHNVRTVSGNPHYLVNTTYLQLSKCPISDQSKNYVIDRNKFILRIGHFYFVLSIFCYYY